MHFAGHLLKGPSAMTNVARDSHRALKPQAFCFSLAGDRPGSGADADVLMCDRKV